MSDQTIHLPKEGDRVGSGIILSLINTGGSAYIYKTWNEPLEIHRAVKVMSPDAPSDVRDRFQTEGRINSKLMHPNIVQCFNFGQTSGGLPFLEMEYLSGPSLSDLIHRRGSLPLPVALAISIGLLDALSYAHTIKYTLYDKQHIGLVHRDLKPANIVIAADGHIKLMDFGIARPLDTSLHTVAGTVPGTVAYMSPEACSGGDVDFRSDIYQFGLCLYEFICGQAAFPQSDLTSLLNAKASNKYQPIENMVKGIDRRIIPVLRRCLQLDPKERYQSANACLFELRAVYVALCSSTSPNQLILSFMDGKDIFCSPSRPGIIWIAKPAAYAFTGLISLFFVSFIIFRYAPVLTQAFQRIFFFAPLPQKPTPMSVVPPQDTIVAPDTFAIPAVLPQHTKPTIPVSRGLEKAPVVQAFDSVQHQVLSKEDALYFIEQGKQQYSAGRLNEALSSFQAALKMPSEQPRQQIVRTCVYWSAHCNTALYKLNSIPLSNYQAAWRSVLNLFPAEASEHAEAAKSLQEAQK